MKSQSAIMACFFRCWRDISDDPLKNKVSMSDLPEKVDIAVLRTNGSEPGFWPALEGKIIPALHKKQIKVVRSLPISELLKPDATAEGIFEKFFSWTKGLDGLCITTFNPLPEHERQQAEAISAKLRNLLGKDRLFIYDANEEGDVALIRSQAKNMDYLLLHAYGHRPERTQAIFDRAFDGFLPPSKFVPGFTFYEEHSGMPKGDVTEPFEGSLAYQKAKWQLNQGTKGGIFSFAVDRDGVKERDDRLLPTTFEWTKKLKRLL
ncbi:hypothetical protein ACIQT6_25220 [Pseudomonas asiatica]|uniref:EndoS/ChiA family endoglycosidase n=1 Tax=Pseudomonas asiatica TaxID=2219225 RepID=UPI00383A9BE6